MTAFPRIPTARVHGRPSNKLFSSSECITAHLEWKPSRRDIPYYGIEIEHEHDGGDLDDLYGYFDFRGYPILFKDDCSINSGAELNTAPADLDTHLSAFTDYWNDHPFLRTHSRVGMHVHISKLPFSKLTLGKLNVFVNDPNNRHFVKSLAGRFDEYWCRYDNKATVTLSVTSSSLSRRVHTMEMRIFKSPGSYKEFAERIQFVDALCAFVQQTSYRQLTWEQFDLYVQANRRKSWSHLVTWLKEYKANPLSKETPSYAD